MKDKELIEKWKKLKAEIEEEYEKMQQSKITNNDTESKTTSIEQSYGGRVKTLGTHPGTGNFFKVSKESENHKGFASALLLGFLTMLFQLLFMAIAYIIIK